VHIAAIDSSYESSDSWLQTERMNAAMCTQLTRLGHDEVASPPWHRFTTVEVDAGVHDVNMHFQERDWVPHLSLYVATPEVGLEPVFEADFPIN
jgi:hypothetical protein